MNGLVVDRDAGWQQIQVAKASQRRSIPARVVRLLVAGLRWLTVLVAGFAYHNPIPAALLALIGALLTCGLPWAALGVGLLAAAGLVAWFLLAPEAFDRWVVSPGRRWWRRRRYAAAWADVMVAGRLVVTDRRRRELVPKVARIRQGRFADVLTVKLPNGITREAFAEHLDALAQAMRAREARIVPAPARWAPGWLRSRAAAEFAPGAHTPGRVFVRLAFGDPLAHVVAGNQLAGGGDVDLAAVRVGRRDDGAEWLVSLLGTHILLAGATGAGKGSVLWALLASIGPAVRAGTAQVVGLDPKGGMELGFGRELFRHLVTMDGPDAEDEAVAFLETLAEEADRRAGMLAGRARTLTPSVELPFVLIIIDELASVTAFISDSKRRQRADAALGRLLTKGRAPGMCVVGALQDPRKDVVKWRDLFPTRIALRLVEAGQVDLVLGDGAHARGARCEAIATTTPGVGYVTEDGAAAITRVRAAYLTDEDIRRIAATYRPGPVDVGGSLRVVDGEPGHPAEAGGIAA
ncbi:cell division protein FtsK [Haloechinothrix sp. YIM 98757]|uniref:Cell division protein FtsK n=1 Tax=Haloechinothrix aidingensis TaxID=2752311 RepID=A0A838A7H9_9PSEU|nr:FtsK/SpoIIIE domain-containing protein [Haloechinothrix aidingensis]MBA0124239.1 cell division protein FtsK [Haloechinothrix aidingensis]